MEKKIIILFSGGIDSTLLVAKYLKEGRSIVPVYISGGFPYEKAEIEAAKKIIQKFDKSEQIEKLLVLKVPWDFGWSDKTKLTPEDNMIPLRNMILVAISSIVMVKKDIHEIALGTLGASVEAYPDSSLEYLNMLENLVSMGLGKKIKLRIPFWGTDKSELLKSYGHLSPISLVFSCVSPNLKNQPCGRCVKCLEKVDTFKSAA